MSDYYDSSVLDFAYYWRLLKSVAAKNYKRVLLVSTLVGGLTFLYTLTLESQYRATTVLHVAPPSTAVFDLRELLFNRRDPAFRQTQVGVIRSRSLLREVVQRLELHKKTEFISHDVSVLQKIKQKVGLSRTRDRSASSQQRVVVDQLIENIEIRSSRDSYLMELSLSLPNPELAAEITNALAAEYIQSVESNQRETSEASEKWLLDRLAIVNKDLQAAELALQEFKETENIIGSSKQNDGFVTQEVDLISSSLLEARQKRLSSEALYQQVIAAERGRGDVQGIHAIQNDSIVQNIRTELVQLERRKGELSQRYGPEHRRMIELDSQIQATNQNLQQQIQRVVSAIKSDYELAKESELFLKNSLGQSTNKVQSLGRKQFSLLALEQNVRTQRDVYQAFLERLNQKRATGVSVNENVRITDPAIAPIRPVPSKAFLLVIVFAALTAMVGFAIGLLRELFDNTINSDEDVDNKLPIVSLGSVPMIEDVADEGGDSNVAYHYFSNHKISPFSESVRTIRSSLMLSSIDQKKRRILFTSTVPGEGKTSMSISTALAFGQVQKTLLIDCDLRRPSLDSLVGGKFERRSLGLNDLCLGDAVPSDCIQSVPAMGIDLITAGTVNPNPQELFCSTKFSELLNKLNEIYDVIIIDSPPCGGLSDALLLSTHVDQIAYVVKAGVTPVTKIRAMLLSMKQAAAPLSGAIVNQVPASNSAFSYYYGYGYYADSVQKQAEKKEAITAGHA